MNLRKDHYRSSLSPSGVRSTRAPLPPSSAARRTPPAYGPTLLGGVERVGLGPVVAERSSLKTGSSVGPRLGEAADLPAPFPVDRPCLVRSTGHFLPVGRCSPRRRAGERGVASARCRPTTHGTREYTTSNGGPLGSCIDEERRELRYLV